MVKDDWRYPLNFLFTVDFQWGGEHASASFIEVSGLKVNLPDDRVRVKMGIESPKASTAQKETGGIPGRADTKLTLKRPLEPVGEKITNWVNRCMMFTDGEQIQPGQLIVKLVNTHQEVTAAWSCSNAYPVDWELSSLDAKDSRLAIETLTLMYASLKRIQ
jgi:phage tail-like protein